MLTFLVCIQQVLITEKNVTNNVFKGYCKIYTVFTRVIYTLAYFLHTQLLNDNFGKITKTCVIFA